MIIVRNGYENMSKHACRSITLKLGNEKLEDKSTRTYFRMISQTIYSIERHLQSY